MARYRKVDTRVWNDAKFRTLSADAKLIFLFLLTHPAMTSLGAMRATIPGMAAELGTLSKGFGEGFGELSRKGFVECDETASFVALRNFLKYNGPENPNVVKSWESALDLIPECAMKALVLQRAVACVDALGETFSKGLPIPFRKGMPNQEQEQEPEPEQEQEPEKEESSEPAKLPAEPTTEVTEPGTPKTSSQSVPRQGIYPEPPDGTVLTFVCNGHTKVWHLVQGQVEAWSESYPGIDVMQEMRKAFEWSKASPRSRKTASGMMKFLVAWLNRANDDWSGGNDRRQGGFGGNPRRGAAAIGPGQRYDPAGAAKRGVNDL